MNNAAGSLHAKRLPRQRLRSNAKGGRHKTDSTPGTESQFEFLCGKVGAIGKGGVLIETDFVAEKGPCDGR